MLEALKSYDKLTADGLLARTSFSLAKEPMIEDIHIIDNQDLVCSEIVTEVSNQLNIKPDSEHNTKKIIDYLDAELERSMALDKETKKNILIKLSNEARLPTDLYKIKIDHKINTLYHGNIANEKYLINNTIRKPDLVYHFNMLEPETPQKDISIFVKYYEATYYFDNFYLLIIGRRTGLDFLVNQAWHIYNEIAGDFSDAMDLLKRFVNKFGVEVEFQGELSKFFLSKIAKSEKEFEVKIKDKNVTKKSGKHEVSIFHFIKPISGEDKNFSLFFVIDILKYKKHLMKHKYKIQ